MAACSAASARGPGPPARQAPAARYSSVSSRESNTSASPGGDSQLSITSAAASHSASAQVTASSSSPSLLGGDPLVCLQDGIDRDRGGRGRGKRSGMSEKRLSKAGEDANQVSSGVLGAGERLDDVLCHRDHLLLPVRWCHARGHLKSVVLQ